MKILGILTSAIAVCIKVIAANAQDGLPDLPPMGFYDEGVEAYQEKDYPNALRIFQYWSDMGFYPAQFDLGMMYATGNGVTQDYAVAAYWWNKAAKQGDSKSQWFLGLLYATGFGVNQNYVRATMWYNIAMWGGLSDAEKSRAQIEPRMSSEDRSLALEMAALCVNSDYLYCD